MIDALAAALGDRPPAVVVIGASAGAVDALLQLLPLLRPALPVPLLVVVHVPADRRNALPALFAQSSALTMCEAEDKMTPEPSTVYFAPPDYHLLIEADGSLALSVDEPVHYSRPAIDVLFESAAKAYGSRVLGILLSGASHDGAAGLAQIRDAGGHTWVQTPESAQVAVMPRAALALAPHATLDPASMGRVLAQWSTCRG
jgi:two-component system, chemotaxis family, protein-glutamate methylesterase/glutaminase